MAAIAISSAVLGCRRTPVAPNVPPVAEFTFNPVAPVFAGQTQVLFNASGSEDSDGSIATYLWNFGDGTPQQGLGVSPVHVFPVVGTCVNVTYSVLLTVVDNQNAQTTASHEITVTNLPDPKSPACTLPSPAPSPL